MKSTTVVPVPANQVQPKTPSKPRIQQLFEERFSASTHQVIPTDSKA